MFKIENISFKEMRFKMSSAKWQTFCLDLNVLIIDGKMCVSVYSGFILTFHTHFMYPIDVRLYQIVLFDSRCILIIPVYVRATWIHASYNSDINWGFEKLNL